MDILKKLIFRLHGIKYNQCYNVHMEPVSKLLTIRLTESEYQALSQEAEERDRPMSYIAREKIRNTMKE